MTILPLFGSLHNYPQFYLYTHCTRVTMRHAFTHGRHSDDMTASVIVYLCIKQRSQITSVNSLTS